MIETYKPSGAFGPTAFPLAAGGAVAMGIGAWLYELAMHWIPLIILGALITFGFAFIGYKLGEQISKMGKIRNPILAAILGVVIGVPAVGITHYSAYVRVVSESTEAFESEVKALQNKGQVSPEQVEAARKELLETLTFSRYVEWRVENGWNISRNPGTSDGGAPISGIFVYLVWLFEALVIVGGCVIGGHSAAQAPFCEDVGEWADQAEVLLIREDLSSTDLTRMQSASDVSDLWGQAIGDGSAAGAITWTLFRTPSGKDGSRFLTVARNWVEVNDKGEQEVKSEPVIANVVMQQSDIDALKAAGEAFDAEVEKAAQAAEAAAAGDEGAPEQA